MELATQTQDKFATAQAHDGSAVAEDGSYAVNALGAGIRRGDVSAEWFARSDEERFTDLKTMHAQLVDRWDQCHTSVIDNKKMEILLPDKITRENAHQFSIAIEAGSKSREVLATHNSFNQLSARVNAPAKFLRTLPNALIAQNLNWALHNNRSEDEIGVFYDNQRLRSINGPNYGRIPDHEVVDAVMRIAGDGTGKHGFRWKVPGEMDWSTGRYHPNKPITKQSTTFYASDRDVFMFLVDDRNPIEVGTYRDPRTGQQHPDLMFRGLGVKNSETGNGTLAAFAMYLRAVCMNRNLWGVEGFEEISIKHTRRAPERFLQEARPALNSFANGDAKRLVDGVNKAKAAIVARDDEKAIEFLNAIPGMTKARTSKVFTYLETEEGTKPRSAWDFGQGITAIARDIPFSDERTTLELQAKRILDKAAA